MPAGALVDGVPMGDLFALANAIAAMVGGAVTIEDPQSYVLAYSSADLPIDEARREVILGRRVPERFLRRLRDAGVFQRLQTTDDVVSYVDQEEEVLPRLAVGIRAGGELLGSIWVAEATESLGADAKAALQEAGADGRPAPDPPPQLGRPRTAAARRAGARPARRRRPSRRRHAARPRRRHRRDRRRPARRGSRRTRPGRRPTPSPGSSDVVGLVALYFESFQRHVAQVTIGQTIYVMIPETRDGERVRLLQLIGDLIERARATVHTRIVSGVGSTVPSVAAASWSRREADLAIRVLAAHPDRSIAPIEDVRAETIVLALRDHALGDAYLRSGPVETLRLHDEQKGTSYVETLEAYFSAFGYVPLAAKTIFVHPNTFRYRLRRLTEISGLDLDDPLRTPRRRAATADLLRRRRRRAAAADARNDGRVRVADRRARLSSAARTR